ncbi:VanZ family protein [Alkalihalobacillus sp. NPDC078783]
MLDFNLTPIFIFLIIFISMVTILRVKRNKSFVYLMFWTVFYVYLVNVFKYTQFPMFIVDYPFGESVEPFNFELVNPFGYDLRTTLLNILMFVPFGFGLSFIAKTSWVRILITSLVFTLIIETLQLMQHLLFAGSDRIFDINDIIYNTLGGLLGYFLFKMFARLFNKFFKSKENPNTILGYISGLANHKS